MPDVFEKCHTSYFSRLAIKTKAEGLYPYFRPIRTGQGTEVMIGDKYYIMLGSNSYLGLTDDPRVIQASNEATVKYGTGNAGSRFLNGTLEIHEELEAKISGLVRKEATLLYSTGYQANLGIISALVGPHDYVITDKADHASIIDGCCLSPGKMKRFRHQDMDHLEKVFQGLPENAGCLVVVDGVYSMEGDVANLPEIVGLARKYGARVMVDDAHGIGVLGTEGRGSVAYWVDKGGISADDVDIISGTFSKSLASLGGFCAASGEVIHYLKHTSRALIFSASLPPGNVGAASRAIDIMLNEPARISRLWELTGRMRTGLQDMGFCTGNSSTPIIPLYIGEMEDTFKMWKRLTDEGLFVNPVIPPAVSRGECLIRTSIMATHTDEQIERALHIIEKAGRDLGVIGAAEAVKG